MRIMGTSLFLLGFICGLKILSTFYRYGTSMEAKWDEKVRGWLEEKAESTFIQRQSYDASSHRATVHLSPESGFIPFEHSPHTHTRSSSNLLPAEARAAQIPRRPKNVFQSDGPTDQFHNQSGFSSGIDISRLPSSLKPISSSVPRSTASHPRIEKGVTSPNVDSGLANCLLLNPSVPRYPVRERSVASPPAGRQGSTPILPSQRYNTGQGIANLDNQRRPTIRFEDEKEDPTRKNSRHMEGSSSLRSSSYPNPPTQADLDAPSPLKSNSH